MLMPDREARQDLNTWPELFLLDLYIPWPTVETVQM